MWWVEPMCAVRCNIFHFMCISAVHGAESKEIQQSCAVNGRCPRQCDTIAKRDIQPTSDWNVNEKYNSLHKVTKI